VGYKLNRKRIDYFPSALQDQIQVKPIYKRFDGWLESTRGIKKWNKLPKKTQKYIKFISNYCGVKISSISTSPKREDSILLENPFKIKN
jgi:adenylosuccinate synthase